MAEELDPAVERLREIVEASGLSVADFASLLGEKTQRLKDVLRGKQRLPGEILLKLPELAGVNPEYLFGVDVPMFTKESPFVTGRRSGRVDALDAVEHPDDFLYVRRYLGPVSAGDGNEQAVEADGVIGFRRDDLVKHGITNPNVLAGFFVKGDSMEKTLFHDDLVVFNLTVKSVEAEDIYLYQLGGQRHVKRLSMMPTGEVRVQSDNPRYDPFIIDEKVAVARGFEVLGVFWWRGGFKK